MSTPAPPAIAGDHWIEALNDGSRVLIRPIRAEDRERERAFVERLSPVSRHYRFLGEIRGLDAAMLDRAVDVEEPQSCAYIALVHEDGGLREVGVSRYADAGDGRCECAVTVADDWQGRGLGVALMRHLIVAARRHGYRSMYSLDAASNEPMRELAAFLGFRRERDPGDATLVVHTLDL